MWAGSRWRLWPGVLYWSALGTGFSLGPELSKNLPAIGEFFRKLFPSDGKPWPTDALPEITKRLIETFAHCDCSKPLWGAPGASLSRLIASRTLAGKTLYTVRTRCAESGALRPRPSAGDACLRPRLGLVRWRAFWRLLVFSFGVVGKLLCDSVETIDPGPMEAIAAAGGHAVSAGVLRRFSAEWAPIFSPTRSTPLRSMSVRHLYWAWWGQVGSGWSCSRRSHCMNYTRVGLIILITFGVVFLIDSFSTWLRGRLV